MCVCVSALFFFHILYKERNSAHFFFIYCPASPEIYTGGDTLSRHDALPICSATYKNHNGDNNNNNHNNNKATTTMIIYCFTNFTALNPIKLDKLCSICNET